MTKRRLELLGGLQVFAASEPPRPITVPAKKVQALLAYLALHPGRPQPRAKLATLLWSESSEAQARASLRQALLVLRRTLGLNEHELVTGSGETVELDAACIEVDAIAFEHLVEDGSPAALERAGLLWHGELLEAFDAREPAFDDWLAGRRQRVREQALALWSRLLAQHADGGRIERAIDAALRLLALDPLQESVHRNLMQLYARQGRRGAALRQFQLCRDLLARELGVRPQLQTQQLREAIERQPEPAATAGPVPADDAELRPLAIVAAESVSLADDMDPEQAQAASERLLAAACEIVERFGGTPERRLGAGITALFGVPVAHSDDVERAARCALRLSEVAADLRVGLAAGTVLVTRLRVSGGPPFGLGGEVPALAMRLASAAEPGDVLVAPAAWSALASRAEGQRCTPQALPASLRATGAWRLGALRDTPATRTSLVGRRAEIGQFTASVQTCREARTGLAIHVRGDPGIGKTRLVQEFQRIAATRGFACHDALVLDFGLGAERDATRSVLRSLLGVNGVGEAGGEARERAAVARALQHAGLDATDEAHLLDLLHLEMPPALRALFDAMDPPTRERRQGEVLARMLQRSSETAPCLVVIEDLHWAPPRTLRLTAALAAAAEHCAALLVTTSRSDGDPLDAAWRASAGVSALLTFDLGPLHWPEASTLAAQFGDVADAFTLRCLERAAGHPLFLEQLLQADRSDGLPDSVHSVVLARLDRLPAIERHIVGVASALGQRFSLDALRHLLGADAVPAAPAHGLLRFESAEGVFAHALVHEGAYASLPRAQRRELHARAARWFAGRDAVLHAEHLERAENPAAAQAYLDAARAQAEDHHHEQALRMAERGLALAGEDGPRFPLACCRAESLHDLGRMAEAQAAWESAVATAADDTERCRAWLGLATVLRVRDDLDGAAQMLLCAERAATARKLTAEHARVHFQRGNLLFPRGDLDGVRREHEHSLALAREAGSVELEVAALGGLGDAEFMRGCMLSAHRHYVDCVGLARRHRLKRIEAANQPMAAITRWYSGQTLAALGDAQAAIDLTVQIGHRRAEAIAHHGAYQFCHSLMDFDAALAHADHSLRLARQIGAPRFEAEALAFRGELLRTTGRRGAAVDELQHALAIARASGMAYFGPVILGMLARAVDDMSLRERSLAEGEALLADNALAHNHLLFRRDAIDACLESGDAAGALHHAAELQTRTRTEPLPWSEFLVARAKALAAGAAMSREACEQALQRGQELGLRVAVVELQAALRRRTG
jgi:DNA-binding SARP family transcriptional activator